MKIEKLRLENFRNHVLTDIECSPTINLITGQNGQGKTNIIEAISYLSLGKSFFSVPDSNIIHRGERQFLVFGTFVSDASLGYNVGIRYSETDKRKEVKINGKEQERISSLVGLFPVVILHPEQHSITNGGPNERRRFLDLVLSQANESYFKELLEYRRILRQRNAILSDTRRNGSAVAGQLLPWDEAFVRCAVRITTHRDVFVRDFRRYLTNVYSGIVSKNEIPDIEYRPSLPYDPDRTETENIQTGGEHLEQHRAEEVRLRTSVVGPHRDELLLTINGLEVRRFASQGQQKSILVALKISESQYLLEKRHEQPLILLDDLFGELDRERAGSVLSLTSDMGQTFVTATDDRVFGDKFKSLDSVSRLYVNKGMVYAEDTSTTH